MQNQVFIGFNYSRLTPFGDLADRFGSANSVGISAHYKFAGNFQIQGGIHSLFGSKVKEYSVFDTLIGSSGYLLDLNGNYAEVKLYERGYYWHIDAGKIFPLNGFNVNSGIFVSAGLGFIQHKIKFNFQRTVLPQIEGDYQKGYDRLTNGLMFRGFAGYQHLSPSGMFNFVAGIEVLQGSTRSRREFNFDTRIADTKVRNDLMLGLKMGIMINIYRRGRGNLNDREEKIYQ